MDRNRRYRVSIDNPIDSTHAGIPMRARTPITYGSAGAPLVAAVLVREADASSRCGESWRVLLASHTLTAAYDLHSGVVLSGRRAIVLPMIKLTFARGTEHGNMPSDAAGNELAADVIRANELAARGEIRAARELLARHSVAHVAVEIVVGTDGERKVRQ
jgi:hypothetical protein